MYLAYFAWRFGLCYHARGAFGPTVCHPTRPRCAVALGGDGAKAIEAMLLLVAESGRGAEA